MSRDMHELLTHLGQAVSDVSPQQAPALLGELERIRAVVWLRMTYLSENHLSHSVTEREADQLLTPEEAGRLLGVTPRWLYRHAKRLPFTKRLSRKALRFSEKGLRRWLAARTT